MSLQSPEPSDRKASTFLESPRSAVQHEGPEALQIARSEKDPQTKFLDFKAPVRDQLPFSQAPNATKGAANRVPSLKLHDFYNCDRATAEVSVEVAVLFMHGGKEDKSPCSVFSTKETEKSLVPPNIAFGSADQSSETSFICGQKEIPDMKAIESEYYELQAKENSTDTQKQKAVIFDYDAKLLQSSTKHIEMTRAISISPRSQTETKQVNWLKKEDMLPSLIPEGRIMGYGFRLDVLSAKLDIKATASLFAKEFNRISGDSKKPIVLIGHGFGNTVIKALLCSGDEESKAFKRLTTAVVFFAPPISESTELSKWSTNKMGLPTLASENAFLALGKGSGELKTVWENFRSEVGRWDTSVFIYLSKDDDIASKTESKDIINGLVRDTAAYIQGGGGYGNFRTSSGFSDIASFSGPNDKSYLKVASQIVRSIQVWQLLDATSKGDETLLKRLIGLSVNINLAGKAGQTSLLLSAQRDDPSLLKVLLGEKQLNIDHQDNHGDTALHIAVKNNANQDNKREMILSLLRAGANPEIRNRNNKKPEQLVSQDYISMKNLFTKNRPLVEGPLIQPRKRLKKSVPPGEEGIKACKAVEMFVTEMYSTKDSKSPVSEQHWTMYKTVYNLIYTPRPGSVGNMLDSERSNDIKESEKPHCRWYHIPENNMVWVEDLFAQLLMDVDPWPSHYRGGKILHSRCMNPEVVALQNLDLDPGSNSRLEGVSIMMPYVSYESSSRQEALQKETLKYEGISSIGHRMEDDADEVENIVAADNQISMGSIQKITFMPTDLEGENQETIDPQEVPANDAMSGGYEALANNDGRLKVPQVPTAAAWDDPQAMRDATDSKSEEDKCDGFNKRPGITGVGDQLRAYLHHKPPLHPRRTLDQSYYYMLENTAIRDSDQVISRYAKKHPNIGKDDHNILMVDQLWIWYIKGKRESQEPDTVITCFPSRQGAKFEHSRNWDDLWIQVLANKIHQSRGIISSASDLIVRVIEVCCGTLDRHQHVEKLQFVQMFEATIGDAKDQETKMLQQFRRTVNELHALDDRHPKYHRFRSEKVTKLLNIQKESGLLKEMKDTRDEIKMIRAILTNQLKVLKSLNPSGTPMDTSACSASQNTPEAATISTQSSIALLHKVFKSLREMDEEFEIMESHAKEVEIGINGLMDLKQRQANLWEARSSREGAEETARQGNILLVFTIVTIIFLPLSFMASFFALAISQFPKDDKGDIEWPLHYVSGLLFGISFAVSIPLLLFAFNVGYAERVWNYCRFVLLHKIAIISIIQLRHVPIWSVRTKGYAWLLKRRRSIRRYSEEGVEPSWKPAVAELRAIIDIYEKRLWNLEVSDEDLKYLSTVDWDKWAEE